MEGILYYPGFEIENENWLKFALLYLKDLNTIVPHEADSILSNTHRNILVETNLLKKHRPEADASYKSSKEAVVIFEGILADPIKVIHGMGEFNLVEHLRSLPVQDTELFGEKFTDDLRSCILSSGFGHPSEYGIKIPRLLSNIYMSILAHNIGDHHGVGVITDLQEQNKLQIINEHTWKYNKELEKVKAVKKLIELKLPRNLSEIPLRTIIELRQKESYQNKLNAFHDALSDFNKPLNESTYQRIEEHIKYTKSDLAADTFNVSIGFLTCTIGTWLAGTSAIDLGYYKELIGCGAVVAGGVQIYNKVSENKDKRLAQRYLTEFKRL